jgi:hypothetical protein
LGLSREELGEIQRFAGGAVSVCNVLVSCPEAIYDTLKNKKILFILLP